MNKKIVDYCIFSLDNKIGLEVNVLAGIDQGLQPFGSLSITIDSVGCFSYNQPMVKYEEPARIEKDDL